MAKNTRGVSANIAKISPTKKSKKNIKKHKSEKRIFKNGGKLS
jgi:hypothetical protein